MPISVLCNRCRKELHQPGALAFGIPGYAGTLTKYHVCVNCWHNAILPAIQCANTTLSAAIESSRFWESAAKRIQSELDALRKEGRDHG